MIIFLLSCLSTFVDSSWSFSILIGTAGLVSFPSRLEVCTTVKCRNKPVLPEKKKKDERCQASWQGISSKNAGVLKGQIPSKNRFKYYYFHKKLKYKSHTKILYTLCCH